MQMMNPRAAAFRAASAKMDFYAVCLVGWTKPRPADFGDNVGVWPVKIVIRKKEAEAAKEWDQESPHAEVIVLEHVLVSSFQHATRLKEALNEVLLGHQEAQGNKKLRRQFRNVVGCWEENDEIGRGMWWSVILTEAQRILKKGATSFEIFDADTAYARITRKATRGH